MLNRERKIEATCREIERLTQYLSELVVGEDEGEEEGEIAVGVRVEITRKDKYYGRRGVVSELRSEIGPMWYVELEKTKHAGAQRIWKKEKYLKVVPLLKKKE